MGRVLLPGSSVAVAKSMRGALALLLVIGFGLALAGEAQAGCTSCVRWYSATSTNTGSTAAQSLGISVTVPTATECPNALLVAVAGIVNSAGTVPELEATTGAIWDADPAGSATNMTLQNAKTSTPEDGAHLRTEFWVLPTPEAGSGTLTLDLAGSASARMVGGAIIFCGVQRLSQNPSVANSTVDDAVTQTTTDISGRMFVDSCVVYGNHTATKTMSAQTMNWTASTGSTTSDVLAVSSRVAQTGLGLSYGYAFDDLLYYSCAAISLVPTGTTAVGLEDFRATGYKGGVALAWRTGMEAQNLGYRLFREDGGVRQLVNPEVIAGSALSYPGSALEAGYAYSWWDPAGTATSRYYLEDVELGGAGTLHGPYATVPSPDGDPAADRRSSRLLSRVGEAPAGKQSLAGSATTVRPVLDRTTLTSAAVDDAQQREVAAGAAAKITVAQEGWYRVKGADLIAAVPSIGGARSEALRLFADGVEQAIIVHDGSDGSFDPSDSIEFYGVPLDTQWAGTQTYWLSEGSQAGRRIAIRGALAKKGKTFTTAQTIESKDRLFYAGGVLNGEAENFFGKVVTATPAEMTVSSAGLEAGSSRPARLEVAVQGFSELVHSVKVNLNGTALGTIPFAGKAWGVASFAIPSGVLVSGPNKVVLEEVGDPKAASAVGYLRLTYPRLSKAEGDRFFFSFASEDVEGPIRISGFSVPGIRVFDVTDPANVAQLRGTVGISSSGLLPSADEGYSVSVAKQGVRTGAVGELRHFLAIADTAVLEPVSITANLPSTLSDPANGADWIAIAHRSLIPALAPLRAARESQGLKTAVVDVEDVFDEFSYGVKSPYAIRAFLRTATTTWQKRPRYVVLVGDGSQDPRDYLGRGGDLVPTKLVDTKSVETSSDDWLADLDADGRPDLALGRIPVVTPAEASAVVGKVVRHDSAGFGLGKALLVADTSVLSDFAGQNRELRQLLPAATSVVSLEADSLGDAATRASIFDAVAGGVDLIHYSGHGTIDRWRGGLLSVADVPSLANATRLPIVTTANCLTGIFQEPLMEGIGEVLLSTPDAGAVAVWGSSGTTDPFEQEALLTEFMKAASTEAGVSTLGEAILRAKASATDADVRATWILLGDPATRVR